MARMTLDLNTTGEALIAGDDVGVFEDAQHCRHHEIAGGEAVAIKIGLVAERFG